MRIAMNTSVALLLGSMCLFSPLTAQDTGRNLEPALEFRIDEDGFSISNGQPGASCAIFIGLEKGVIALPGATLLVNPLLVLWHGTFDNNGEHRWQPEEAESQDEPINFYAQALTANEDLTRFRASNLVYGEYDDGRFSWRKDPDAKGDSGPVKPPVDTKPVEPQPVDPTHTDGNPDTVASARRIQPLWATRRMAVA